MPISSVQIRAASSSSWNTVTHSRSFGMPERSGDEIPGEMDRLALEVVAEAEVAEHLEKRVVPGGVADVLQIVVLAAGAHAALRGGRARIVARLLAEKHILELDHAGIREQQRRIIPGHERTRRHHRVAVLAEELQKAAPGSPSSSSISILRRVSCLFNLRPSQCPSLRPFVSERS